MRAHPYFRLFAPAFVFALITALGCGDDPDAAPDADDAADAAEGDAQATPADADDVTDAGADADPGEECEGDGECDDAIACTVGSCSSDGTCSFDPDDAACDDENECTENTCDPEEGCEAEPVDDGEACAEGAGSCQGGVCVEGEEKTAAFRKSTVELQHPHLILEEPDFDVCDDITFDPLVVFGAEIADGVNPSIADEIEDLEFNVVTVLNDLEQEDAFTAGAAVFDSECEDEATCEPAPDGELASADYSVQTSGSCIDNIPGIFGGEWPDGETSNPNTPAAGDDGCFATEPADVRLEIEIDDETVDLPLQDGQIGAEFGGDPAGSIQDGVVIGFLTEDDADDTDIEFDTDDFGTFTYNLGDDLLPTDGPGDGQACEPRAHCGGPDARVTHEGACGWWFALNIAGERLSDASPYQ